jgi:hypothetical protein
MGIGAIKQRAAGRDSHMKTFLVGQAFPCGFPGAVRLMGPADHSVEGKPIAHSRHDLMELDKARIRRLIQEAVQPSQCCSCQTRASLFETRQIDEVIACVVYFASAELT